MVRCSISLVCALTDGRNRKLIHWSIHSVYRLAGGQCITVYNVSDTLYMIHDTYIVRTQTYTSGRWTSGRCLSPRRSALAVPSRSRCPPALRAAPTQRDLLPLRHRVTHRPPHVTERSCARCRKFSTRNHHLLRRRSSRRPTSAAPRRFRAPRTRARRLHSHWWSSRSSASAHSKVPRQCVLTMTRGAPPSAAT